MREKKIKLFGNNALITRLLLKTDSLLVSSNSAM